MASAPIRTTLAGVLLLFGTSCGRPQGEGEPAKAEHAEAEVEPRPPEAVPAVHVPDPEDGAGTSDGEVGKAEPIAETTDTKAAEVSDTTVTKAADVDDTTVTKAEADAASTKTTDAVEEPAKPDPAPLLKEAKAKATGDERALAALAEAEAAGAGARDVAKAAFERAKILHATPERAASFLRFAADKDPKYPDAVFELAKQAVVAGDVDETVRLLKQVKERRGEKLLQQIEFDPTWEIVKDDPAVRALL